VRALDEFVPLSGAPPRSAEGALIGVFAQFWSVSLPDDFLAVACAYGDAAFSGFIYLCGSRTLESYSARMGPLLEKNSTVPYSVLPSVGGALLWGITIEGDQLFLVPREGRGLDRLRVPPELARLHRHRLVFQ
jgi:hypothetical protein